jgi:hypothetical protein
MHKSTITHSLAVTAASLVLVGSASAQTVLTQWTFETSIPSTAGPFNAEVGTGQALGVHASGSVVYSNPVGNGSAESFSSTAWAIGDYYQFSTSTTSFTDIGVRWDQASSGTGPRDFDLLYSTDGTNFTLALDNYVVQVNGSPNVAWNSTTFQPVYHYEVDLSGVAALENAATVFFRLVMDSTTSAAGGTVAAGGTDRVDNFTVLHSVPEPSAFAALLGGVSLLGLIRRRRA